MAARSPPAQSYLGLQIAGLLRGGQLGDGTGRQTQGPCAAPRCACGAGSLCDRVLAVMLAGKLFPFARLRSCIISVNGAIAHRMRQRGRACRSFFSSLGTRGQREERAGSRPSPGPPRAGRRVTEAEKDRRSNSVWLSISISICVSAALFSSQLKSVLGSSFTPCSEH